MKILNILTIKHLKANKKRTILTIMGIMLATFLMIELGLLFSSFRDNGIGTTIKYNGDYHVNLNIKNEDLNFISKNDNVLNYKYKSSLGYSLYEGLQNKKYLQVLTASKSYLDDLKLIEGRLPNDENEVIISNNIKAEGNINLNVGDTIKLNVGQRECDDKLLGESAYVVEYKYLSDGTVKIVKEEHLINTSPQEYKIVGIVEKDIYEEYSNPGYSIFTISEPIDLLNVYVKYKNVFKTIQNSELIIKNLNYESNLEYNNSLLYYYGIGENNNFIKFSIAILLIILLLITIASVIVIYNAFAISVTERIKQFGLFSSIGATKKQLRYTLFFEVFVEGIIGIVLGLILSFIGINIILSTINKLLVDSLPIPLELSIYPLYMLISIIFIIFTIVLAAYYPTKKASRVSPIEAIRLNNEIKIKKFKTPKLIKKLGIEAEIAYKNMKRNKKKYNITILSLFLSIVLYVSFSSFLNYTIKSSKDAMDIPSYDYFVRLSSKDKSKIDEIINQVLNIEGVKQNSLIELKTLESDFNLDYYTDEVINEFMISSSSKQYVYLYLLDDKTYEQVKKQLNVANQPILLNYLDEEGWINKNIKGFNLYKDISSLNIYDDNNNLVLDNIYMTDIILENVEPWIYTYTLIVDKDTFNKINTDEYNITLTLNGDNFTKVDELLHQDILDVSISTDNIKQTMQEQYNTLLAYKIILYGFVILITLIGVTSVINTINMSVTLRRQEFAMLRSIGLTPKGFNKMIIFECLLFGLKSLLYGISVSLVITYLFHLSFNKMAQTSLIIPYTSIIIAIFGIFVIVLITMWYATKQIKKENILDIIRKESI